MLAVAGLARADSSAVDVAKQAYVYGFPMVDFYRIYAAYFLFPRSPVYKTGLNSIYNTPNVLHAGRYDRPDAELRHTLLIHHV
jgi:hypothetical protein